MKIHSTHGIHMDLSMESMWICLNSIWNTVESRWNGDVFHMEFMMFMEQPIGCGPSQH